MTLRIHHGLLIILGLILPSQVFLGRPANHSAAFFQPFDVREGDIVFKTSQSAQSRAIQLATHSIWSHCGVVFKKADEWFVLEAIQPVSITPLSQWIARGRDRKYRVKRLKNAQARITPQVRLKMWNLGKQWLGKPYDLTFEWSDTKLYCSELVWKLYKNGLGISLVEPKRLRDFDLSHPEVQAIMARRYGKRIPLNEPVISPSALFDSPELEEVTNTHRLKTDTRSPR